MSADDIVKIIAAIFAGIGGLFTMYMTYTANRKLNQAAQRREEIASSPPGEPTPPPTLSPPKV